MSAGFESRQLGECVDRFGLQCGQRDSERCDNKLNLRLGIIKFRYFNFNLLEKTFWQDYRVVKLFHCTLFYLLCNRNQRKPTDLHGERRSGRLLEEHRAECVGRSRKWNRHAVRHEDTVARDFCFQSRHRSEREQLLPS